MKNKSLFLGSLLLAMIASEVAEAKSSALENTSVTRFQQEEIEVEGQVFDTDGSPMLGVSVVVKGTEALSPMKRGVLPSRLMLMRYSFSDFWVTKPKRLP